MHSPTRLPSFLQAYPNRKDQEAYFTGAMEMYNWPTHPSWKVSELTHIIRVKDKKSGTKHCGLYKEPRNYGTQHMEKTIPHSNNVWGSS